MSSRNKRNITAKDILYYSNNGITIYKKELNLKNKGNLLTCNCPFHSEKTPSFYIYPSGRYKCYGCGESGNVFDFVSKKYGLNFKESLNKISKDLKLSNNDINYAPILEVQTEEKQQKRETLIEFSDFPFQARHKKYWDKYHLPENFLKKENVFAVKAWAINGKLQKTNKEEAIFAYYHEELDKVKILRIGENVKKEDKWRNNVPNDALWYLPKEKCSELWVSKSVKDSLVMKFHFGKCSCAVQNEDWHHLDKNMSTILDISTNIVLNFGSDKMGVENCKIIQQKYNTKYFNTPKYLLQYGIQDISDLIDQFGVDVAKKELIKKKFL